MTDVYYEPATYGLAQVGEVDFSSGSYEFNLLTVWRRTRTGELLFAEDRGCSCPSPFGSHLLDDGADPDKSLVPASKHDIVEWIQYRLAHREDWEQEYAHTQTQAVDLIGRLMAGVP